MLELDIELKPSKQFVGLITLVLLGSFFIIISSSFSGWNRGWLLLLVTVYGAYILFRHALLRSVKSVTRLVARGEDWRFVATNGQASTVYLLGESTLTKWVCILRYQKLGERRKNTCIVFRDSLEKEQYRRLLVASRCSS